MGQLQDGAKLEEKLDVMKFTLQLKWFLSRITPKVLMILGITALLADAIILGITYKAGQRAMADYAIMHAHDPEPVSTAPYSMALTCKNCLQKYQQEYPLGSPVTLNHACPTCKMLNPGFDVKKGK